MNESNKETPRITVSNYTKIWTLDWVIYALEGKKLPFPTNLRVVGIFVITWIVFYILGNTFLIFLPGAWTKLFIPIFVTWVLAKQKLDGKTPHMWLYGMLLYWMRAKRLYRYRKFEHNKRYVFKTKVVYRTQRERT